MAFAVSRPFASLLLVETLGMWLEQMGESHWPDYLSSTIIRSFLPD